MKTYDQRGPTDCMRCCLATVLGLDYERVPDFVSTDFGYDQRAEVARWLDSIGCRAVALQACGDGELLCSTFEIPSGLWIAGGPTQRGTNHAVVYDGGAMVHDPHPSRAGLLAITDAIVPLGRPKPDGGATVVALHEAGHAVVADALGFKVTTIEPTEHGYRMGFDAPEDPSGTDHFLMAVVTAGGVMAQQLAGHEQDQGCIDDLNHAIRSIVAYLGYDEPPVQKPQGLDAAIDRVGGLARAIIRDAWPRVLELARWIDERKRLDAAVLDEFFSYQGAP